MKGIVLLRTGKKKLDKVCSRGKTFEYDVALDQSGMRNIGVITMFRWAVVGIKQSFLPSLMKPSRDQVTFDVM